MSINKKKLEEELKFEKIIWGIFIIGSLLSIVSDNLQIDYLKNNDKNKLDDAYKVSLFVLILSIVLNSYFVIRNYRDYKNNITINNSSNNNNNKSFFLLIRLIGSILLILGVCCSLYYLVNNKNSIGSSDSE